MEAIADYTNHLHQVPLEQQKQQSQEDEAVKQKEKVKKRTFSINARALMPSNWSSNSHGRKLSRQSGASTSSAAALTTTATAGGYHTKSVLSTP